MKMSLQNKRCQRLPLPLRMTVLFLVFSFLFSPLSKAFAEEPLLTPENLTTGLTGARKHTFATGDTSGAFTYSYKITTPPGRNGIEPNLNIGYNNQRASDTENLLGYGWNLNIPYIQRLNKSGTDKLYTDNYFYSSLSGELVNISGTSYGPKVEDGSFLKYTYNGTYWTVKDKSGKTYSFGASAAKRQDDPSDSSKVYKWMLGEIRDTNDNYIKYEYYKDTGQIYPDKIKYTGNGTTDGIFEVEFLRQARSDTVSSYATSFLVKNNYRINEIQVKINGTWTRKYVLTYTTGDNGLRSLLSSITESAQDESSIVTTLPATSFTYYTSTAGWTIDSSTWAAPQYFSDAKYQSFVDVNGDSLPDIIESFTHSSGNLKKTFLNNNNGTFSVNTNLAPPILFRENEIHGGAYNDAWDQGVRVADLNGDLLPDIVKAEEDTNDLPNNYPGGYDAYINNSGSSWIQNSAWHPTLNIYVDTGMGSYGSHFLDLNADGLSDILRKLNNEISSAQLNNGTGFSPEITSWDPPSTLEAGLQGPFAEMADLNGDNLPDIIYSIWTTFGTVHVQKIYLNGGNGTWIQDNSYFPVQDIITTSNIDAGVRFFDVNNDGLLDVVSQYSSLGGGDHGTYLNTGIGWVYNPNWNVPDTNIDFSISPRNIVDINTDGSTDFFVLAGGVTKVYKNNTTVPVDTLKKITFPQGGDTVITYKRTPKYVDSSGNLLNPNLPVALDTVYQTVTTDGVGGSMTETFSYEGGSFYYNSWDDRRLAGFAKITKTDSAGNKEINYYHQGNTTNSSLGEYSDHSSKIGKVYRTEFLDNSNNVYKTIVNKWDKYSLGTGRDFVKLVRKTEMSYDGGSSHKDTSEEYTYDNTYGNMTARTLWGEVIASVDGSFTDTGTDKYTEDMSYVSNTTDYIVGLLYNHNVYDQSVSKIRQDRYFYDGLSIGSVGSKGNLTKSDLWKGGSIYVKNFERVYDTTYGLVLTEKDPRNYITTYTYNSDNLYPASVTNPKNQVTSYVYDYSLGKPKQTTDANSRVFEIVYDGLDRVLYEKQPNISEPTTLVNKTSYVYTDTAGAVSMKKTDHQSGTTATDTYTYFDGLGRKIQEKISNENDFAVKDFVYNNVGLLHKVFDGYANSVSTKTSTSTDSGILTTNTYDALKRISTSANGIGTTTYAYTPWKTTITDPRGKTLDLYKDAYDNLIKVDEHNSIDTYTTMYEWDGNKALTKQIDADGNIRNFTYDKMGRRLTAEDLHPSLDGTYGVWQYTYDNAGNLTQVIDPNGKTINMTYDSIDRMLTLDETSVSGIERAYGYDSGTDAIGRLTSVTTPSYGLARSYNALGLVSSDTATISGTAYTTAYTYDRQSNPLTIENPDLSKVKYTYNVFGIPETIQTKETTDSVYQDLVTDFDYNPKAQVSTQINANGTTITNTYDTAKMLRLQRRQTTSAGLDPERNSVNTAFYAGAGDDYVAKTNTDWIVAHDATSGGGVDYVDTTYDVKVGLALNGYKIHRVFVPFDTSSIPDTATILSAKLKVYVESKQNMDNDGDDFVTVVQASQASPTTLTNTDYDNLGTIEGIDTAERKDITSVSTGSYLEFNLNTTGKGFVNKSGHTLLALREGHDLLNTAFTGNSAEYNYLKIRSSDYTGTTYDPILEITYTDNLPAPSNIQDLNYTYDNNNNITKIIDSSSTDTAKTIDYTYDDLNRLLSATATNSSNNYSYTYTYGKTGNITSSPLGTYTYSSSNYANPHAVTSIGSTNYTYDNNGNLLTETSGLSNTWDYDNRLIQTVKNGITTTYDYDHQGQRIKMSDGINTTVYPSKYYNVKGSEITKHVFNPKTGELLATIRGTGANAVTSYIHTDHLGSTDKVTNTLAEITELSDYYPYGSPNISTQYAGTSEQRKYTGHEFDKDTELTYANARYYDQNIGRFLSQDPVYLLIGSKDFEKKWNTNWRNIQQGKNSALNEYLSNPQNLNSYSYAINNPLKYTDPTGESPFWEKVFNFGAGRGFKTDSQILQGNRQVTSIQDKMALPGKNLHSPTKQLDFVLERGTTLGPSQEARYKVAEKIDKFSGALDVYSELDSIPGFAASVAAPLSVIPSVGPVAATFVIGIIEASFPVSDLASVTLERLSSDIKD